MAKQSVILMRERDKKRREEEREREKARHLDREYAIGRRSFDRILPMINEDNE